MILNFDQVSAYCVQMFYWKNLIDLNLMHSYKIVVFLI